LRGDYNHNGIVDAADYTVWRDSLGSTNNLVADGDGNGAVDPGDYDIWKNNFAATSAAPASRFAMSHTAPEPNGLELAIVALAGFSVECFVGCCRLRKRA
jgi:hypothetical protein